MFLSFGLAAPPSTFSTTYSDSQGWYLTREHRPLCILPHLEVLLEFWTSQGLGVGILIFIFSPPFHSDILGIFDLSFSLPLLLRPQRSWVVIALSHPGQGVPTSLVVKWVSVNALKSLEGKNRQNCKKTFSELWGEWGVGLWKVRLDQSVFR